MNRHPPADNEARHFLDMMVRAQRAGDLLAKSASLGHTRRCRVVLPPGGLPCRSARYSSHPYPMTPPGLPAPRFGRGNPYLLLRERLGAVFDDADFADLYPRRGQPAYAPWRLAVVTLLQFREGLSDRQAAEAVRARIDWKYLLSLDLDDAGFDHTVLCAFRDRLRQHGASERLLTRVLDGARASGLLKARGRQRTDSTHVLAAVRQLNRIELLAETLRATLNAIATVTPEWLRTVAPADWHDRYDRRIEDMRLPETGPNITVAFFASGASVVRRLGVRVARVTRR
jgi:transposase